MDCGSESLVNKKKRVRGVSHGRVYGGVTSCSFLGLTRKEDELSCWRPPRRQPMGQHKPALGLSFSLKSLRYLFPIPTIGSRQTWRSPSLFPHLNVGFTCWCFQGHIRRNDVSGCVQSKYKCFLIDIGSCCCGRCCMRRQQKRAHTIQAHAEVVAVKTYSLVGDVLSCMRISPGNTSTSFTCTRRPSARRNWELCSDSNMSVGPNVEMMNVGINNDPMAADVGDTFNV